jgi:hypothetical protein
MASHGAQRGQFCQASTKRRESDGQRAEQSASVPRTARLSSSSAASPRGSCRRTRANTANGPSRLFRRDGKTCKTFAGCPQGCSGYLIHSDQSKRIHHPLISNDLRSVQPREVLANQHLPQEKNTARVRKRMRTRERRRTDNGRAAGPLLCESSAYTNSTWLFSTKNLRLHLPQAQSAHAGIPHARMNASARSHLRNRAPRFIIQPAQKSAHARCSRTVRTDTTAFT